MQFETEVLGWGQYDLLKNHLSSWKSLFYVKFYKWKEVKYNNQTKLSFVNHYMKIHKRLKNNYYIVFSYYIKLTPKKVIFFI